MSFIKNYDEAREALYPHLREYLEDNGIDTSNGNFRCINPDHEDNNPSMGILPDGKVFHCFSCMFAGDIFHAAHILEKKPMVGHEFIQENLLYLANKYGVETDEQPLTEEQIYKYDTYRAYRAAGDLIINNNSSDVFRTTIDRRGWSAEICREYGVGSVPDYRDFRETLKKLGFSASFLDDIDLGRKEIFGEDRLIFTIRDDRARPVGFASRNLAYTEDKQNGAKYVNQKGTGLKCNIYKKSTRLFGLDRVLASRTKPSEPVYIFEGYSDVVTTAQNGARNAVALGSATLTLDQLFLLKDHNLFNIILCLDGDKAGQKRTADMLDTVLSGHKDLRISIINMPEQMDPDEYINAYGINKFKKLKKWSAFEWRLSQFTDDTDPEEICKNMIPLIINEASYVSQESMCTTLSKATGVTIKAVQQELERLQDLRSHEKSRGRQLIFDKMVQSIQKNPDDAEYALHEAETRLFDLAKQYEDDSFSETSCVDELDTQKIQEESKDGSLSGFELGPELVTLQNSLNGNWRKDVWLTFGGRPNSGKTSFLCRMAYAISSIKNNNATVIYHSIDDTLEQVIPKFVAIGEGSRNLSLNEITDPNYHKRNNPDKDIDNKREVGYSVIRELVKSGNLVLKDANHGISISFADRLIRYYKNKFPDRNIVYILDNFHKLSDFQSSRNDERVRFKELSKTIKGLATKHHICVVTSVEYRKTQNNAKAGNQDIAESIQIEYDANLIVHVHNELHDKKHKSKLLHMEVVDGQPEPCPTIELEIGKNKITGFKGSLYYDFFPYCSDFISVPEQQILFRQGKNGQEEVVDEEQSNFC
jgi:DNA primase catalytic core